MHHASTDATPRRTLGPIPDGGLPEPLFLVPGAGDESHMAALTMKRAAAALALVVTLTACGDSGLTEGGEGGDVTVSNHPALFLAAVDRRGGPGAVRRTACA